MKKFGFAAVVVSGMAAAILGLTAPAQAAPTGVGDVEQTISRLEAQGYHVIVNRIGSAPLDQATVVAIREGQSYSRTDGVVATTTGKTVYIDVK
jgi:hypothetical protein